MVRHSHRKQQRTNSMERTVGRSTSSFHILPDLSRSPKINLIIHNCDSNFKIFSIAKKRMQSYSVCRSRWKRTEKSNNSEAYNRSLDFLYFCQLLPFGPPFWLIITGDGVVFILWRNMQKQVRDQAWSVIKSHKLFIRHDKLMYYIRHSCILASCLHDLKFYYSWLIIIFIDPEMSDKDFYTVKQWFSICFNPTCVT